MKCCVSTILNQEANGDSNSKHNTKRKQNPKYTNSIHCQHLSPSQNELVLEAYLVSGSCWIGILKNWFGRRWAIVEFEHVLKMLWEREPSPSHPPVGREKAELWVPYRGIFPSKVVEDSAPPWMLVGPASNIVDLAIDHQPLISLLIVFLDLLPAVHVETFSGHATRSICLLLYRDLTSPICYWFPIRLILLTQVWLTLSYKVPIPCMLVFKLRRHCTPLISGLAPEISNICLWLDQYKMTLFLPSSSTAVWCLHRKLFNLVISSPSWQWAHPQPHTSLTVLIFSALLESWSPSFSLWADVLAASSFIIKCPLVKSLDQSQLVWKLWPAPGLWDKAQVTGLSYTATPWSWVPQLSGMPVDRDI